MSNRLKLQYPIFLVEHNGPLHHDTKSDYKTMTNTSITSEYLHNKNCYLYLRTLYPQIPEFLFPHLPEKLAELLKSLGKQAEYNPGFAYAELYTLLISTIEDNLEVIFYNNRRELLSKLEQIAYYKSLFKDKKFFHQSLSAKAQLARLGPKSEIMAKLQALDDFIFTIYVNDNNILEQTFEVIKEILLTHRTTHSKIEHLITKKLKDQGTRINKNAQSPADKGSPLGLLSTLMADNFKPQYTTNIPTVRHYDYSKKNAVTELRLGTQAQRNKKVERISPLFECFLEVQNRRMPPPIDSNVKISHIYFNFLGWDRESPIGMQEKRLTEELHSLEKRHKNIAVFTLPAAEGLMERNDFKITNNKVNYRTIYKNFLEVATQDPNSTIKIKDFFISDTMRKMVFNDNDGNYSPLIETQILQKLLDKSFLTMGVREGEELSSAKAQAVWFHFIKFELPNHLITTIKPTFIHFSCKDAIDRGGVASIYYNLMTSIEQNSPLTREEFECGLHAAPAMVKARGMNFHINIIWNALDAYINANYNTIKNTPSQAWLIEWRDSNCPHARIEELLKLRIEQSQTELNEALSVKPELKKQITNGLKILENAQKQSGLGVSGKRLLLEAVAMTPDVILQPHPDKTARYANLADELQIKYPTLTIIAGLMKALAGIIFYVPSFGYSKPWIKSGWSSAKAGFHASSRNDMQKRMNHHCAFLENQEESGTSSFEEDSEGKQGFPY